MEDTETNNNANKKNSEDITVQNLSDEEEMFSAGIDNFTKDVNDLIPNINNIVNDYDEIKNDETNIIDAAQDLAIAADNIIDDVQQIKYDIDGIQENFNNNGEFVPQNENIDITTENIKNEAINKGIGNAENIANNAINNVNDQDFNNTTDFNYVNYFKKEDANENAANNENGNDGNNQYNEFQGEINVNQTDEEAAAVYNDSSPNENQKVYNTLKDNEDENRNNKYDDNYDESGNEDEMVKIKKERKKLIDGDVEVPEEKKRRNRKGTNNIPYRAFVPLKPSCNRYMANKWNNYINSIHRSNIINIKKTIDNSAPKKFVHLDQKLKMKQMKKEKEHEIKRCNQNILSRMIFQGKNNVGTSNLDDNNEVIEPVFKSLNADKKKRDENSINRESYSLLKRLKEKKPYCSVDQWKRERSITEVYLRNISTYPENYPVKDQQHISQKNTQQKHVPPIKKNENQELRRERSPIEKPSQSAYSGSRQQKKLIIEVNSSSSLSKKKSYTSGKRTNKSGGGSKSKKNTTNNNSSAASSPKEPKSRNSRRKPRTESEVYRNSTKQYKEVYSGQNAGNNSRHHQGGTGNTTSSNQSNGQHNAAKSASRGGGGSEQDQNQVVPDMYNFTNNVDEAIEQGQQEILHQQAQAKSQLESLSGQISSEQEKIEENGDVFLNTEQIPVEEITIGANHEEAAAQHENELRELANHENPAVGAESSTIPVS